MKLETKKEIKSFETKRQNRLKKDDRVKYLIANTGYYLALPYSLAAPSSAFSLGKVRFKVDTNRRLLTPESPIPDSWFVSLGEIDETLA
jgi:hypothetical protein